LDSVLGTAAVAQHPERQAVERPGETVVEDVKGSVVTICNSP
jgi:hypothetical protein